MSTRPKPFRWPDDNLPDQPQIPDDLLNIDFEAVAYPDPKEVLEIIPKDIEFINLLCKRLSEALASAYQRAEYLEKFSKYDAFSASVPSIAHHPQNENCRGIYPAVRLIIDLWEALVSLDRDFARRIVENWSQQRREYTLFHRMVLHAVSVEAAFDGTEAASSLQKPTDEDFWL